MFQVFIYFLVLLAPRWFQVSISEKLFELWCQKILDVINSDILKIHYSIIPGTLNPCYVLNGGCEEQCNVAVDGRVQCSCSAGKVLNADGIRCSGKLMAQIQLAAYKQDVQI